MIPRVFFVTALDFTYHSAARKRLLCFGKSLRGAGIESRYYSLVNGTYGIDEVEARLPERSKRRGRGLLNLLRFVMGLRDDCKKSDLTPALVLYPTSYQILDIALILLFRISTRYRIFADINEVRRYTIQWKGLKSILSKGGLRRALAYLLSLFADMCFAFLHGHIYISLPIQQYFGKKNAIVVPILCDDVPESRPLPKRWTTGDTFQLGFAGTVDVVKERMEIFFAGLKMLLRENTNVVVNLYGGIGDKEKEALDTALEEYGLAPHFRYRGVYPRERLIELLVTENHALILPRGETKQNAYGFSTKLTDYLEAQLPIVTSRVGDVCRYFTQGENAILYDPGSPLDFAENLSNLIENYDELAPRLVEGANALRTNALAYKRYSLVLAKFFGVEPGSPPNG